MSSKRPREPREYQPELAALGWGVAAFVALGCAGATFITDGASRLLLAFLWAAVGCTGAALACSRWAKWRGLAGLMCDQCSHPLTWHAIRQLHPNQRDGAMVCLGTDKGVPCGCPRLWRRVGKWGPNDAG